MRKAYIIFLLCIFLVAIRLYSGDTVVITVAPGETLWDIAGRFYKNSFAWKKLLQYNDIQDPDQIKVGQKLIMPIDDEKLDALLNKKWLMEAPTKHKTVSPDYKDIEQAETFTREMEEDLKLRPLLERQAQERMAQEKELELLERYETPVISAEMKIILDVTPPYLDRVTLQLYPRVLIGGGQVEVRVDCVDTLVGLADQAWAELISPYDFQTKIKLELKSDSTGTYYIGKTMVPERAENEELFVSKLYLEDKLGNARLYDLKGLKEQKKLKIARDTSTKYVSDVAVLLTILIYSLVH